MAKLMSLPLTASCFSKIQISFTILVPDHPGNPGQSLEGVHVLYVCVNASIKKNKKVIFCSIRKHTVLTFCTV